MGNCNTIILPDDYVFRCGSVKICGGVMNSHHFHNEFEFYYLTSGKGNYFIDDKSYKILPGDMILVPEGVIHRTNYSHEEHSRMLIECSYHFIPEEVRGQLSRIGYLYRNPTISKEILAIFKKVEDEYKNPDEYSLEALKAHMRLLCYILVRNQNTVESPDGKNAIVDNIVVFIKNSFHTDITLSAMAKEHFISSEHLSRIFKNETGFGFNEYLTLVRLQHAQNLLKHHNEMSISEVAYACGFNDSNYFSDKFKKMYGIAPLRYSKTCK